MHPQSSYKQTNAWQALEERHPTDVFSFKRSLRTRWEDVICLPKSLEVNYSATSTTRNGRRHTELPASKCIASIMAQSGKAPWCLYLPGLCIHAVPVVPGSNEELHLQHPQTPPSFSFYHLVPPSSNEPPAGQQVPLQHPAFRSLYSDEPPLEQHPAFRGSSTLKSLLDDDPTIRLPWRPKFPSKLNRAFQRPPIPDFSSNMPAIHSEASTPGTTEPTLQEIAKLMSAEKAFENTSTSVAASQMRNALNNLADTVKDPEEKKVQIQPLRPRKN